MSAYETNEDRAGEDRVAHAVASKWKCEYIRTKDKARLDTMFTRDSRLVAVAEIKCRHNRKFGTYNTVQLNLQKYFSLLQFEMAAAVPTFMIYAFEDGIYYVRAATIQVGQCRISVRGRQDRGNDERQPVIEISNMLWRALKIVG